MSGTHKYPTISFRISPREREEIEAKIFASGMKKKDYFVRSCIYNRVCVVGKKETVYQIVERLQEMENRLVELAEQIDSKEPGISSEEIRDLQEAYEDMLASADLAARFGSVAALAAAGALAEGAIVSYEHAAAGNAAADAAAPACGLSLASRRKYGDTVVDLLKPSCGAAAATPMPEEE